MQKNAKYAIVGTAVGLVTIIILAAGPFATPIKVWSAKISAKAPYSEQFSEFFSHLGVPQGKAAVLGETSLILEVADTDEERIQGLSGRRSLNADTGLLFMFETDGFHGIWMKDMNFPIDIVWINKHFEIIHIEENVDPSTYPESFEPDTPARFIIEVNAGFVEAHNIEEGDLFTIL